MKSDPKQESGIFETLIEERKCDPLPDELEKVALGVIKRFVLPEHAMVCCMPCPNWIGCPLLREIFAAKVVWKKMTPPKRKANDENNLLLCPLWLGTVSIGSSK